MAQVVAMFAKKRILGSEVVSMSEVPMPESIYSKADSRGMVLVADGEPLVADTLSAIFVRNGYTTLTAYDGQAALELARTMSPDVLIADVTLPGMNVVALGMVVGEILPDCKVLLFSGHAGAADKVWEATAAGHDFSFLAKPAHPSVLLAQVVRMVGSGDELHG